MSETAEQIKGTLMTLSPEDRAELAHFLISSLDDSADADVEAAWDAELECRVTEIESGQAIGKPAEEVFAELRKKYS